MLGDLLKIAAKANIRLVGEGAGGTDRLRNGEAPEAIGNEQKPNHLRSMP
jgi:hypothetical protein